MSSVEHAIPAPSHLGEALKRAFFRSFFRLLLGFIALAEWASVAWSLHVLGVDPPRVLHVVAPVAIFLLNRWIVLRRGRGGTALRVYVACAFTSIFCALVLLLAAPGALALQLVPGAAGDGLRAAYFWLVNGLFVAVAGLLAYGYLHGRRELTVSRVEVGVRDLPGAFDGFRIVHISDLHIGQHLDLDELAEHVRRVNALEPDLVCVTGDLVDRPDTCTRAFPTLGGLRARHGVVVTLGNHDFYAGADLVSDALRRLTPFTLLRDAATHVEIDGARLAVLGVDDLGLDWARGVRDHPALPPLAAAVPNGHPFVVLSHRPDCFGQAANLGAALMLRSEEH